MPDPLWAVLEGIGVDGTKRLAALIALTASLDDRDRDRLNAALRCVVSPALAPRLSAASHTTDEQALARILDEAVKSPLL